LHNSVSKAELSRHLDSSGAEISRLEKLLADSIQEQEATTKELNGLQQDWIDTQVQALQTYLEVNEESGKTILANDASTGSPSFASLCSAMMGQTSSEGTTDILSEYFPGQQSDAFFNFHVDFVSQSDSHIRGLGTELGHIYTTFATQLKQCALRYQSFQDGQSVTRAWDALLSSAMQTSDSFAHVGEQLTALGESEELLNTIYLQPAKLLKERLQRAGFSLVQKVEATIQVHKKAKRMQNMSEQVNQTNSQAIQAANREEAESRQSYADTVFDCLNEFQELELARTQRLRKALQLITGVQHLALLYVLPPALAASRLATDISSNQDLRTFAQCYTERASLSWLSHPHPAKIVSSPPLLSNSTHLEKKVGAEICNVILDRKNSPDFADSGHNDATDVTENGMASDYAREVIDPHMLSKEFPLYQYATFFNFHTDLVAPSARHMLDFVDVCGQLHLAYATQLQQWCSDFDSFNEGPTMTQGWYSLLDSTKVIASYVEDLGTSLRELASEETSLQVEHFQDTVTGLLQDIKLAEVILERTIKECAAADSLVAKHSDNKESKHAAFQLKLAAVRKQKKAQSSWQEVVARSLDQYQVLELDRARRLRSILSRSALQAQHAFGRVHSVASTNTQIAAQVLVGSDLRAFMERYRSQKPLEWVWAALEHDSDNEHSDKKNNENQRTFTPRVPLPPRVQLQPRALANLSLEVLQQHRAREDELYFHVKKMDQWRDYKALAKDSPTKLHKFVENLHPSSSMLAEHLEAVRQSRRKNRDYT
jgi:hypothetical protein